MCPLPKAAQTMPAARPATPYLPLRDALIRAAYEAGAAIMAIYASAGLAKLAVPEWQNGSAMLHVRSYLLVVGCLVVFLLRKFRCWYESLTQVRNRSFIRPTFTAVCSIPT